MIGIRFSMRRTECWTWDSSPKSERLSIKFDQIGSYLCTGSSVNHVKIHHVDIHQILPYLSSATWLKEVQSLADDFLGDNYIHATIGSTKLAANKRILQIVDICDQYEKVSGYIFFIRYFATQLSMDSLYSKKVKLVDEVIKSASYRSSEFYRRIFSRALVNRTSHEVDAHKLHNHFIDFFFGRQT